MLRDKYPSFNELCKSEDLDEGDVEAKLLKNGFVYDPAINQFR